MRHVLWPVVFAASLAFPAAVLAQERSPHGGGESYGPGANYLIIPSTQFVPFTSQATFGFSGSGYYFSTATPPSGVFWAAADLPAGASVVNVCMFTYDNDPANQASVQWEAFEMGDAGGPPGIAIFGSASTGNSPAPGYGQTCVPLANPTFIRKYQDLNGDGHTGFTWYRVTFTTFAQTNAVRWGGAVITWLRTVSPAPGIATFGDVPTNFLYFKAIEALAASGITGGCGSGNFCPNQNVTRGEMAAFLARALGLHWPL